MTTIHGESAGFSSGLARAFSALGNAFLAQPQHELLRQQMRAGALSPTTYYAQLRGLTYRLLFITVAEARGVLPDPGAARSARQRYQRSQALGRGLYTATEKRTKSLYQRVLTTLNALSHAPGDQQRAIPALGTFLSPSPALGPLQECTLPDAALIDFFQALSAALHSHPHLPEDVGNFDGDVVESIHLAAQQWQPVFHNDAAHTASFQLLPAPGTPTRTAPLQSLAPALVARLLDSTLDPVLHEALAHTAPAEALRHLKICDPACGPGTLLRAAAWRLAPQLARLQGGETRQALRDVVCHCLYGVDIEALSVELCRFSLALEIISPGTTLSSLEHHIRCGDSLAGSTPALLARGIPDTAFRTVADDTPGLVLALRKQHQQEHQGQMVFTFPPARPRPPGRRRRGRQPLDQTTTPEVTPVPGSEAHAALLAHAWCAAFVWPKTPATSPPITHDTFCQLQTRPDLVPVETRLHIARLAEQYRFWHWHLAFPEVFSVAEPAAHPSASPAGWSGGFDVLLSRLPWSTLGFDAQAWGTAACPEIVAAPNATARRQQLAARCTADPIARKALFSARYHAERRAHMLRHTGQASQAQAASRQTAIHFILWSQLLIRPTGRVGCLVLVPAVLRERGFIQHLLEQQSLASFATITNEAELIPCLPRTALLGLLALTGPQRPHTTADVVWLARQPADLDDPARHAPLQADDLALLNPTTRAYPALRSARDAALVKTFYRQLPILRPQISSPDNTWQVEGATMLHLRRDAALLRTPQQLESDGWRGDGERFRHGQSTYVPVYEGAMLQPLTCPVPQRWLTLPDYWIPAGHVIHTTTHVPEALLRAYEHKHPGDILRVLASWLGGHHLALGHQRCSRDTLARTYNPVFHALPLTPGAWTAEPELARRWPFTSDDLRLIQRQHDVLLLAQQLIAQRCPTWLVSWRERLDPTYMVHATVLPRVGLAQSAPWLRFATPDAALAGCLVANLSSLVMAFCVRQKLLGTRLTPEMLYQLPVIPPSTYATPCSWAPQTTLQDWLMSRVLALLYTIPGLTPWARECGYESSPLRIDEDSRAWYRSELEAAYFHLYGCARSDVQYLLDTMPAARPSAAPPSGTLIPERILQSYDALQQAVLTGMAYRPQVALPGTDAHGSALGPAALSQGYDTRLRRLVAPRPEERYKTCVPLCELQAVVHACAEGQEVEPESWITVPAARLLRPGMFVARMVGAAMEPQIPDGAYCLFERQGTGNLHRFQGRIVLAQHQDIDDPDTGGSYTVRRYVQEQSAPTRRPHTPQFIRLLPLQVNYPPIVLSLHQAETPCIIAEFLSVLGQGDVPP